jgi:hypothetical protein
MDYYFYDNLIYEKRKSIPDTLCDEIIQLFESNKKNQYEGITIGGFNKKLKITTDMVITNDNIWKPTLLLLINELNKHVTIYKKQLNYYINNYNVINNICLSDFLIAKYVKHEGKYDYHHDFHSMKHDGSHRYLTFIWYLNDIEDGGETEFFGYYKIKPEKGKLLLFPATWCFPHRGCMPFSCDKYIITGWLWTEPNPDPNPEE